jgi:siderophore synthetase component
MATTFTITSGPLTVSHTISDDALARRALAAFARARYMPDDLTTQQQLEYALRNMLMDMRSTAIQQYTAEKRQTITEEALLDVGLPI